MLELVFVLVGGILVGIIITALVSASKEAHDEEREEKEARGADNGAGSVVPADVSAPGPSYLDERTFAQIGPWKQRICHVDGKACDDAIELGKTKRICSKCLKVRHQERA